MRPDTYLILGDFEFSKFEVPEKITFGGDHTLVTHKLIGGARVIDSMGRDDAPLEWSGIFTGPTALDRARYLDGLRVGGASHSLTFDLLAFEVVISSFRADYERYYHVPYRISCTVLRDLSNPVTTIADPGIDQLISDDMNSANLLGDAIGDGPLSSMLGGLNSAISTVSSFATATQSVINSVLQPLAAVQARVRILTSSVGGVVSNVTTLGGILPNNPIAQQASKLLTQTAAMQQLPQLYNLQSVLGRMQGNLGTIGSGNTSVTQAGGNLYSLASQQYGNAAEWTTIANANGLNDPQLSGINTLNVPAVGTGSGGVLSA